MLYLSEFDSTSLFFVLICDINSQLNEKDSRKIIFDELSQSKYLKGLNAIWCLPPETEKHKLVFMKLNVLTIQT